MFMVFYLHFFCPYSFNVKSNLEQHRTHGGSPLESRLGKSLFNALPGGAYGQTISGN